MFVIKSLNIRFFRLLRAGMAAVFLLTAVMPSSARAQLALPAPGAMVSLSAPASPAVIKGLIADPKDPMRFQFIVDPGTSSGTETQRAKASLSAETQNIASLRAVSERLVKYFLAALATPENEMWVNLSPVEKDRIIPDGFGRTAMGRDLLAQDYLLKQVAATLLDPDSKTGKEFWAQVYEKASKEFGTTEIPVDTFNKVWITPDTATIYTNGGRAYITACRMKVQLESDYLATQARSNQLNEGARHAVPVQTEILRKIIIPALEKEVNEGANFAPLRQVYHSLILAAWFKRQMKQSLLTRAFADRNSNAGLGFQGMNEQDIYRQYLEAFRKGVVNLVREEPGPDGETIPRKYFSGGFTANPAQLDAAMEFTAVIPNGTNALNDSLIDVILADPAKAGQGRDPSPVAGRLTDGSRYALLPIDNDYARQHAPQLLSLINKVPGSHWEPADLMLPDIWEGSYSLAAIHESGAIIGVLIAYTREKAPTLMIDHNHVFIRRIAVSDEYRRQGITTSLFEDLARNVGSGRTIALQAAADNPNANATYLAMGFKKTSTLKIDGKADENVYQIISDDLQRHAATRRRSTDNRQSTPPLNGETVTFDHFDTAFDQWLQDGIDTHDLEIFKQIMQGNDAVLQGLLQEYPGKVDIKTEDKARPDRNGRTVYLTLAKPFGDITILRMKGVRPRATDDPQVLASHKGDGFSPDPVTISTEGDPVITRRVIAPGMTQLSTADLQPQGALLKEQADREFALMQSGTAGRGFETDTPLAAGLWKDKTHAGRPTGFVIAGMRGPDVRIKISTTPDKRVIGIDPNALLFNAVTGASIPTDPTVSRAIYAGIGRTLRAYHDAGYFHRYPHNENWGIELSADGTVRVILRDLESTVARAALAGQDPRRMEAAYRFIDLQRVVADLSLEGYARSDIFGIGPQAAVNSRPLIEALTEGYFPEVSRGSTNFEALLTGMLDARFTTAIEDLRARKTPIVLNGTTPYYGVIWQHLHDLANAAQATAPAFQEALQKMNGRTITGKNGTPYTIEVLPLKDGWFSLGGTNRFKVLVNAPTPAINPNWLLSFGLGPLGYVYGEKYGHANTVGLLLVQQIKNEWIIRVADFNPVRKQGAYAATIRLLEQFTPPGQRLSIDEITEETTSQALFDETDFFQTPLGNPFAGGQWRLVDVQGTNSVLLEKTTAPANPAQGVVDPQTTKQGYSLSWTAADAQKGEALEYQHIMDLINKGLLTVPDLDPVLLRQIIHEKKIRFYQLDGAKVMVKGEPYTARVRATDAGRLIFVMLESDIPFANNLHRWDVELIDTLNATQGLPWIVSKISFQYNPPSETTVIPMAKMEQYLGTVELHGRETVFTHLDRGLQNALCKLVYDVSPPGASLLAGGTVAHRYARSLMNNGTHYQDTFLGRTLTSAGFELASPERITAGIMSGYRFVKPGAGAKIAEMKAYGHIVNLVRSGALKVAGFDPALLPRLIHENMIRFFQLDGRNVTINGTPYTIRVRALDQGNLIYVMLDARTPLEKDAQYWSLHKPDITKMASDRTVAYVSFQYDFRWQYDAHPMAELAAYLREVRLLSAETIPDLEKNALQNELMTAIHSASPEGTAIIAGGQVANPEVLAEISAGMHYAETRLGRPLINAGFTLTSRQLYMNKWTQGYRFIKSGAAPANAAMTSRRERALALTTAHRAALPAELITKTGQWPGPALTDAANPLKRMEQNFQRTLQIAEILAELDRQRFEELTVDDTVRPLSWGSYLNHDALNGLPVAPAISASLFNNLASLRSSAASRDRILAQIADDQASIEELFRESGHYFTLCRTIMSAIELIDRNQWQRTSWTPTTGTAALPLRRDEQFKWFMEKIFMDHPNAATNRALFLLGAEDILAAGNALEQDIPTLTGDVTSRIDPADRAAYAVLLRRERDLLEQARKKVLATTADPLKEKLLAAAGNLPDAPVALSTVLPSLTLEEREELAGMLHVRTANIRAFVETSHDINGHGREIFVLVGPDGKIAGRTDVTITPNDEASILWVWAEPQRSGKGTTLLETALAWARDRHVAIATWTSEPSAIFFYHNFLASRMDYTALMKGSAFTAYLDTWGTLNGRRHVQEAYVFAAKKRMAEVSAKVDALPPARYLVQRHDAVPGSALLTIDPDERWSFSGEKGYYRSLYFTTIGQTQEQTNLKVEAVFGQAVSVSRINPDNTLTEIISPASVGPKMRLPANAAQASPAVSSTRAFGITAVTDHVNAAFTDPIPLSDATVTAYFGANALEEAKQENRTFSLRMLDPEKDLHFLTEWKTELLADTAWLDNFETTHYARDDNPYYFPYFRSFSTMPLGLVSTAGGKERLEGFLDLDAIPDGFDGLSLRWTFSLDIPKMEIYYKNIGKNGRFKGVADLLFDRLLLMTVDPGLMITGGIHMNAMTRGSKTFAERYGFTVTGPHERSLSRDLAVKAAANVRARLPGEAAMRTDPPDTAASAPGGVDMNPAAIDLTETGTPSLTSGNGQPAGGIPVLTGLVPIILDIRPAGKLIDLLTR